MGKGDGLPSSHVLSTGTGDSAPSRLHPSRGNPRAEALHGWPPHHLCNWLLLVAMSMSESQSAWPEAELLAEVTQGSCLSGLVWEQGRVQG